MNIKVLLQQVKKGEITVEEAEQKLKKIPFEDLGDIKIDHHRSLRRNFGEVIYCEGKTGEQVRDFFLHFQGKENLLGTRCSPEQGELVTASLPEVEYENKSRLLRYEIQPIERVGKVLLLTGGTSDIPVAEEAAGSAEFFGAEVQRIYDVGVAGLPRLLAQLDTIQMADVILVVAGMEGALASVVGGLASAPVIAVPTSVGYGASFGGVAPLLSMLNSCAEGVLVVNIDNGYGAGYSAAQIIYRQYKERR